MDLLSAVLASCGLQCLLEASYRATRGTAFARLSLLSLFSKPWVDIAGALYFARSSGPVVWAVLAMCIANRLRALHELTHMAVHNALPLKPGIGELVSNVLYQLPAAREDFRSRVASHVFGHHSEVGGVRDPNLWTFGVFRTNRGLLPNVLRFYLIGWHRIASASLANLTGSWRSVAFNTSFYAALLRTFAWQGLALYTLSLLVTFPLLSLSSLMFEHLWALEIPASAKGKRRVMCVTRDITKASWLFEALLGTVFLYTDRLHHLHHMYPLLDHVGLKEMYKSHMVPSLGAKTIAYAPIGIREKFSLLEKRRSGPSESHMSPQNERA
jgi:fatty acid desaturase